MYLFALLPSTPTVQDATTRTKEERLCHRIDGSGVVYNFIQDNDMLCTHMLVTTEDNTVNRRWHRVTICRSPGEQHNIRGIVVSRNRALCGKTARALGNPKVRQRLPPLPLLSPRGGQTEYHGSMETLAVYPFARSRSGRERTWRLPPTRFQQHCRLIPHDKGPPILPIASISGGLEHAPLGRARRKVTTSAARGGWKPAFPARHSIQDGRVGALLAVTSVCPRASLA